MESHASYWEHTSFLAPFDVLIVGGGIVGCAAALFCAATQPRLRIGVIERGSIPSGASTRNAGFATFGSISEVTADIEALGEPAALDLIRQRSKGLQQLLQIVSPQDAQYTPTGGYDVFRQQDENTYQDCLSWIDKLNPTLTTLFGGEPFIPDDLVAEKMQLNEIAHVIRHPYEGVLHPGKLMLQLMKLVQSAGIFVMNGFDVRKLIREDANVLLKDGFGSQLKTKYVIVATNAFAGQLIPDLPLKPARNQVYVTGPVPDLMLRGCFHYDQGYLYFREVDGRVLIGGARNTDFGAENTGEFGLTDNIRNYLTDFMHQHILHGKSFHIDYAWSGIIGVGDEKRPIVKMVDERIAVAVRLSGMGVAIGSLIGAQAAQLILSRI